MSTNERLIRAFAGNFTAEKRGEGEDSKPVIAGYAAKFNEETRIDGYFQYIEKIEQGAFARAIKEKHDVRALVDHNPSLILARTTNKTLELSEDETGLMVNILPVNTTFAKDTIENVRVGNISQMSFAFRIVKQEWQERGAEQVRIIKDVDLFDVSLVTYPAYEQTEAYVRSAEGDFKNFINSKQQVENFNNNLNLKILLTKI